jgi:hypothetical protein
MGLDDSRVSADYFDTSTPVAEQLMAHVLTVVSLRRLNDAIYNGEPILVELAVGHNTA